MEIDDRAQMRIEELEAALRYAANQLENCAGMLPRFAYMITPEVAKLRGIAGDKAATNWIQKRREELRNQPAASARKGGG